MSEILFSSSYDEKNPPENILSPSKDKFFSSTGMFPQEICIQFDSVKTVNSVGISSYGIKKISVQTCENDSVVNFKTQAEKDKIANEKGIQKIKLNLSKKPNVKVLKIEVLEGYEDFFSIHSVDIQ